VKWNLVVFGIGAMVVVGVPEKSLKRDIIIAGEERVFYLF